ncbi:tandem-95 repeat protein [Reichenbachiella ulvae]|uniref:Tandem-95 repeat protein n=1 Tax=Reichenbachiella ulvae TaxID=2980104 RepID=A0ABT3CNG1_9BACT|nr:tandem-95 repeat protein [Reichenbachiella ulvae]MCV9385182.1 tandem-95 repeat protein [Reichenbachiella ulvae]
MRIKFLVGFLSLVGSHVFGQTLNSDWITSLGNSTQVSIKDIELDTDGNVYVVGLFNGTGANFNMGNTTPTAIDAVGADDAFFAKYDANGELAWVHTFGTEVHERFNALTINSQGDILLTGYLGNDTNATGIDLDPGTGTASVTAKSDALVAKYDADGNYLDHFVIGGENTGVQEFLDIAVNHGDSIYVAGYFKDPSGTVADMDPGTETKNLHTNSVNQVGIIGFYKPNFEFIYGRRTSSNSGNQFSKLLVDGQNRAFTVLEWAMTENDYDIAIEFEYAPTYEAALGSRTKLGDQGYSGTASNLRYIGAGKSHTILQLTDISWKKTIVGGASVTSNLVHDWIATDNQLYIVGQLPMGVYVDTYQQDIHSAGGVHGYIMKTDLADGANTTFASIATTTTATDYIHSVDTVAGNLILSGHWNGNGTLDLDPGTGTSNISYSNPASYWTELDTNLGFVQGGFLASSVGNNGMTSPRLFNLGENKYLFAGQHDDEASFTDAYSPDIVNQGASLAQLTFIANQPPVVESTFNDTTIVSDADNYFRLKRLNLEDLFSDPDDAELTYTASSTSTGVYRADAYYEETSYLIEIIFNPGFLGTAEITVTAEDNTGNTADFSFNITTVEPATLSSHAPQNGTESVARNSTIRFGYSQDLDNTTIDENVHITSNLRSSIAGNFSTPGTDSVVFTPDSDFLPKEIITVVIDDGLMSSNSTHVIPYQYSFTTTATQSPINALSFADTELGFNATQTRGLAVGDLDADGDLDIVASTESEAIVVYMLNDGFGNFGDPVEITNVADGYDIKLADLNGDGHLDIVTCSRLNRGLISFMNDGNLTFTSNVISSEIGNYREIEILDYNNDGLLDIMQSKTDNQVYLHIQLSTGSFQKTTMATWGGLAGLAAKDLNNDGKTDIIYASYSGGDGIFIRPYGGSESKILSKYVRKVSALDFNQDGWFDILYTTIDGEIGWLENEGSLTFVDHAFATGFQSTFDLAPGDVDGDGDIDIAYSADKDAKVAVMLNDGTGQLSSTDLYTTTQAHIPYRLEMSDVDGDEDLDIVATFTNATTAIPQVIVLKNNIIQFDPPEILAQLPNIQIDEDEQEFLISNQIDTLFSDPVGDGLTYTVSSTDMNVAGNLSANSFTLSASNHFFGSATLTLSATNAAGTTDQSFDIEVLPIDDAPLLSIEFSDLSGDEDSFTETLDLSSYFTEVDEEEITFSATVSSGEEAVTASLDGNQLTISGVENGNGTAQIEVIAEDPQSNQTTAIINVTVNAINDAPTFDIEDLTIGKDFEGTEIIELTDLSPANETEAITYSIDPSSISFASVTIDASTGHVSVTAIAGEFGSQLFTITADDGQTENNTTTGTFTLEILDNESPIVVGTVQDQTFDEDASNRELIADVSTLFSDPEGAQLSYEVSSSNTDVSLELANNRLTYAAPADYFGTAIITLEASDGNSTTTATFTLAIQAINDAPVVNNPVADLTATEEVAFSFFLPSDQFSDVDNENLNLNVEGVPSWLNFDGLSLTLHGTPSNEDVGVAVITMTATDGEFSTTDEFTITVENVNDAPTFIATMENQSVAEDFETFSLVDLDTLVLDIDGDILNFQLTNNSATNAEINVENVLILSAIPDNNGTGSITLEISDGIETISTQFELTVNAINDQPSFTLSQTDLTLDQDFADVQHISINIDDIPADEIEQNVSYSITPNDGSLVTFNISGTEIEITTVEGAFGTQQFTITADDQQAENNLYSQDFTLTVVETILSTQRTVDLNIYPNPTSDYLMINGSEDFNTYQVLNLEGQIVSSGPIYQSKVQIDVTHLKSGIYMIRLDGEKANSYVSRLIKN